MRTDEEIIKEHYSKINRKGGLATAKKHGREYMRALGKKGAAKRWNKETS